MRLATEVCVILPEFSGKCWVCYKKVSLHHEWTLHTLLATPVFYPDGYNRFREPGAMHSKAVWPCHGSPWRPGYDPGSVHVGFVVDTVALGQVFPEYFGFPLSISFHQCSITWKNENLIIFLFIFITGLHNKPKGCGASVASAAGPFSKKKKLRFAATR